MLDGATVPVHGYVCLRQDSATVPVHGHLCFTQDGATVTISGPISGTGTDSEGDVLDEDDVASDISPLSRTSSERSSGRLTRIRDRDLSGNKSLNSVAFLQRLCCLGSVDL